MQIEVFIQQWSSDPVLYYVHTRVCMNSSIDVQYIAHIVQYHNTVRNIFKYVWHTYMWLNACNAVNIKFIILRTKFLIYRYKQYINVISLSCYPSLPDHPTLDGLSMPRHLLCHRVIAWSLRPSWPCHVLSPFPCRPCQFWCHVPFCSRRAVLRFTCRPFWLLSSIHCFVRRSLSSLSDLGNRYLT
jgi:hypothetical protein